MKAKRDSKKRKAQPTQKRAPRTRSIHTRKNKVVLKKTKASSNRASLRKSSNDRRVSSSFTYFVNRPSAHNI